MASRSYSSGDAKTGGEGTSGSPRRNINRLMYHAKQRGWLELDLIIGQWARDNLEGLTEEELGDFEELLAIENPDLFKFLTGQIDPEPHLESNRAFRMIRESVQDTMSFYGSFAATKAPKGANWVRGWDDKTSS
eukprot:CAMPEP_0118798370 /NCGR_PEP_ID=MMETSP1161-20130426/782_1 /TAXON_ID=249345 /ORGANISM="Picochlorum oklahomensis, Strain CCMP2329" /LENGTH=133 /DNA_ID=CAMNT_0006725771 /DNA_START=111 /DNA_END=512 /DNA_ORIENTATION=+